MLQNLCVRGLNHSNLFAEGGKWCKGSSKFRGEIRIQNFHKYVLNSVVLVIEFQSKQAKFNRFFFIPMNP